MIGASEDFIGTLTAYLDRKGHGAKGVLADQVGISRQHLYDILKGRVGVGVATKERIEAAISGHPIPLEGADMQNTDEELIEMVAAELELLVGQLRSDALDVPAKVDRIARKLGEVQSLAERIGITLG